VIPTIPFDIIAGYASGAVIALSAAAPLERTRDAVHTRYFGVVLLFAGLTWVPSGLALFLTYPDWSLMYLANPAHLPLALSVPFLVVSYLVAPAAGFLLTHQAQQEKNPWWLRASFGVPTSLALLVLLVGHQRLLTVAYYDAFHLGLGGVSLFRSPLLIALSVVVAAVTGAFAMTLKAVKAHVRRTVDGSADIAESR
jgi:hypothetical protein